MTPEQATDLFIDLTEHATEIDASKLDRAAILAHFTEIFAR
jgi:hypothetical protein